jgi:hypothetical protein
MLASPNDLRDYRSFRLAQREGSRLACAERYLRRHPHGAWTGEVREAFDAEEPVFFEQAQTSRSKARQYLIDLPDGPHADAARALLVLFDAHQDDIDTLMLLASARRTAALLDRETDRRKRLTDLVLQDVASLLDRATYGASLDEPPPLLASVLRSGAAHTWGGEARPDRLDQVFFVVPTPEGSQPREVDVGLELRLEGARIVEGRVSGGDLFVRWAEALLVRVLDPTDVADRTTAATTVSEVLRGALEGTFPQDRCGSTPTDPHVIVKRACDGWSVTVTMGPSGGSDDAIDVRGPT